MSSCKLLADFHQLCPNRTSHRCFKKIFQNPYAFQEDGPIFHDKPRKKKLPIFSQPPQGSRTAAQLPTARRLGQVVGREPVAPGMHFSTWGRTSRIRQNCERFQNAKDLTWNYPPTSNSDLFYSSIFRESIPTIHFQVRAVSFREGRFHGTIKTLRST